MEAYVFGNEFFDQWLHQKSLDIMAKVERETISTEDMLILSLKAQVNHFHHMDVEFREEFKKIDDRFEQVDQQFERVDQRLEKIDQRFIEIDQRLDKIDHRFEQVDQRLEQIDQRFEQVDQRFSKLETQVDKRFELVDKRFDHLTRVLTWGFALFISTQLILLIKSFG